MIFCDATYYETEYLMGRAELIPLSEVEYWLTEATDRINWRGLPDDELEKVVSAVDDSTLKKLKRCTCKIADALFVDSEKEFMSMEPSQTVGPYTKTIPNVKPQQVDFEASITRIIIQSLSGTMVHNQFVYRGI